MKLVKLVKISGMITLCITSSEEIDLAKFLYWETTSLAFALHRFTKGAAADITYNPSGDGKEMTVSFMLIGTIEQPTLQILLDAIKKNILKISLTAYAAGDRAKLIYGINGNWKEYTLPSDYCPPENFGEEKC